MENTADPIRLTKLDPKLVLAVLMILVLASLPLTSLYMALASTSYAFLVVGLLVRRTHLKTHVVLMNLGILIDLGLVLVLEFQRDAIATAISNKLSTFQQCHVAASSIAALLYLPVLSLGWIRYRNPKTKYRDWHSKMGLAAFFFRTIGFLLMFSMLYKK